MNVVKIAAGFACGLLIVLFALIIFLKKPEKERYEKTVESIMIHKGLSSAQEVLDSFPALKDIKSKMKQITDLNTSIDNMTGGPAPNVSGEESLRIQNYTHKIRQLRSSVNKELSQLVAIHVGERP